MRLICPHCSQSIAIPDSDAGKSVNCPLCGQAFPAPELYSLAPEEPLRSAIPAPGASPPPPVEETPAASPPLAAPPTPAPPAAIETKLEGYKHSFSFSLHPATLQWLAPIGLTLALVLTFFKWNGCYPAGYSAYTQNAWQGLFGSLSSDPVAEKEMGKEAVLKEKVQASWWLLPYLMILIPAAALAWAHHLVGRGLLQLPKLLQGVWSIRLALLAGLAGSLLLLLLLQSWTGFGLENAIQTISSEAYTEASKAAKTPEEIQSVQMKIAQEAGRFQAGTTFWLSLALVMHLLALVGIAAETSIQQRGRKPPPRVGFFW